MFSFQLQFARSFQRPFCRNVATGRRTVLASCRNLTIPATPEPNTALGEPPKAKPKATTPLRRSASASLPIRANPTPTRGDIQTVFTLATAERYLLSRLRLHPDLPSRAQALHESWWIPKWGQKGKEGEVFVFANGSFVCWGLGEQDARRFAAEVIDRAPGVKVAALKEAETEELEFVVDPIELGDIIILGQMSPLSSAQSLPENLPPMAFPQETLLARYAYSQALSRSTALSALEVSLDEYLTSMAQLPHSLEKTGKPGMGRKALIKKLGQLMKFRQGLNLNRENFSDVPDFYWAEPELERYFDSLTDALDVKERTTSVNDKITYAAEAQSVLRQLLTESSTHSMELVIIALIAVEVVIALIRDGPELWDMLTQSEEDKEHDTAKEVELA
ncbi:MIOREX complex component 10 [Hypsizygus marmoreus]|uniref:MIOREX complex component 10 n=1 Tax=Hypsizygus marmoreus TaxID=39966 RepID=A0A369JYA8_HYPMA|nr:MIOREX complex component 10 [Hypsizygus marmoreus]